MGDAPVTFGQEGDICGLCGTEDCPEAMLPRYDHDFDGSYRPGVHYPGITESGRETQVGGNHYAKLAIQPGEYAMANGFNYWQSHALTYLTRYRDKNGAQDIDKAIHCLQMLKESEYGPSRTLPDQNPEP